MRYEGPRKPRQARGPHQNTLLSVTLGDILASSFESASKARCRGLENLSSTNHVETITAVRPRLVVSSILSCHRTRDTLGQARR